MQLIPLLHVYQPEFCRVVPVDWSNDPLLLLDFTAHNPELQQVDVTHTAVFSSYVFNKIKESGAVAGIGGYAENRSIYRRSPHFNANEQPRTIHLGIDIWMEAGTPVFAPLAGTIHSFQNNAHFGDYGPTIILAHQLEEVTFYTLYGHLNVECLEALFVGKRIEAGEQIAQIGPYPVNGDWPPHLHFQLISDMEGRTGDFPGVCAADEREKYLQNCPDPNLILGIDQLRS